MERQGLVVAARMRVVEEGRVVMGVPEREAGVEPLVPEVEACQHGVGHLGGLLARQPAAQVVC